MPERSTLTVPTDLKILSLLSNGRRQTPANVAAHLDRDRAYMSNRLRFLTELGYLHDAPPAKKSGMYEITTRGIVAAWHGDQYVRGHHDTFHSLTLENWKNQPDNKFLPDLVWVGDEENYGFVALTEQDTVIPSELDDDPKALPYDFEEQGFRPEYTGEILYRMFWHGFADRVGGLDAYRITNRGELVHDLVTEQNVTGPVELTERVRETYSDEENERLNQFNRAYGITKIDS
ncbi:hypothetical protein [Halorubrum sp. DTA98]|uniref:hypothetical protein n=1 Tax=Halorubrum sp. DTA98 TaxID=3402163 RepID=UPI003AAFFD94